MINVADKNAMMAKYLFFILSGDGHLNVGVFSIGIEIY